MKCYMRMRNPLQQKVMESQTKASNKHRVNSSRAKLMKQPRTSEPISYQDFKFRHIFSLLVVGSTQLGKTVLLQQILQRDHIRYENPSLLRHIYWLYGHSNHLPAAETESWDGYYVCAGFTGFRRRPERLNPSFNNICILDDLMDLAVDCPIISKLFTQSRRRNSSIIILLQNAFPKGKHNTSIWRNAQYTVLFRSPADRRQIGMIADRVFNKNKPLFMELYNKVTSMPYSYVLIDNKPHTPGDKQFIVDIFGNCRYFPGINNKRTPDGEKISNIGTDRKEFGKPMKDVLRMNESNGPLVLNLTMREFDVVCDNFHGCPISYNPDTQWDLWCVIELKDNRFHGHVGYYPCVLKDGQRYLLELV